MPSNGPGPHKYRANNGDPTGEQYHERIARLRDLADKLERLDRQTSPDDVRINLYEERDELTLVFQRGGGDE